MRSPETRRCALSSSVPKTWAPPPALATAIRACSSTRWLGTTTTSPLPVSVNPQVTFERMFGDPGTPEQRLARLACEAEHAGLGARRDEASAARDRRGRQRAPRRIPHEHSSRRRTAAEDGSSLERHRDCDWRAHRNPRGFRPAHDGHVRPPAPRVPRRHHARVQLHARPRGERPKLRARGASKSPTIRLRTTRTRRRASISTRESARITW